MGDIFSDKEQTQTQIQETTQETRNYEGVGQVTEVEAQGDIELTQTVTDQGAIQAAEDIAGGAFDFAGEFGSEALDFANDVSGQAREISTRAVDTLSGAITRAGDVSRSDTADTLRRVIPWIAGALAVISIGYVYAKRSG